MRGILWSVILAVMLSACFGQTGVWLVSGTATSYESRKEVQKVALTANQLQTLARWIERRRRNWGAYMTEASNEPVSLSLDLR
jgi:hypothetical protein